MGKKYRILSEKNVYSLPKEDYLTAIHYALRYPLWVEELRTAADTGGAIRYDKEKVQTSINGDPTADVAIRMAEIASKVNMIDDIIKKVANGIDNHLRMGVCYGLTFDQLKAKGIPCERDAYYIRRRHFYYELSKRI